MRNSKNNVDNIQLWRKKILAINRISIIENLTASCCRPSAWEDVCSVVYSQFPEALFESSWPDIEAVTQFHIHIIGFHDLQHRNGDHKQRLRPLSRHETLWVKLSRTRQAASQITENTHLLAASFLAAILQWEDALANFFCLEKNFLWISNWIRETIFKTELQVSICV